MQSRDWPRGRRCAPGRPGRPSDRRGDGRGLPPPRGRAAPSAGTARGSSCRRSRTAGTRRLRSRRCRGSTRARPSAPPRPRPSRPRGRRRGRSPWPGRSSPGSRAGPRRGVRGRGQPRAGPCSCAGRGARAASSRRAVGRPAVQAEHPPPQRVVPAEVQGELAVPVLDKGHRPARVARVVIPLEPAAAERGDLVGTEAGVPGRHGLPAPEGGFADGEHPVDQRVGVAVRALEVGRRRPGRAARHRRGDADGRAVDELARVERLPAPGGVGEVGFEREGVRRAGRGDVGCHDQGLPKSSMARTIWGKLRFHAPGGTFSETWISSRPECPACSRIERAVS